MCGIMTDPDQEGPLGVWLQRLLPTDIKASIARLEAMRREQLEAFDTLDLAQLREAAIASLTAAAAMANAPLTTAMLSHGWTQEEKDRLASFYLKLVDEIDTSGPGSINMGKWFDFTEITPYVEDELKSAAFDASEAYNAYVRRRWPQRRG